MGSRIKDFARGFGHLVRGFTFLASHPRLWPWAILPTAINLLLLAAMLFAFIHYYGDIYGWLSAHLGHLDIAEPTRWYWHLLDAILWVADLLFQLLIVLAALVILLVASYGSGFVIASPFNDALSERVEVILTGVPPPTASLAKFLKDTARVVWVEAMKAAIFTALPIALLAIAAIPVAGGPLYVAATFILGAWGMGFAYADLPLGRRAAPLSERFGFGWRNFWALAGLGSGFAIPFFGLIFAAPMAVAGTILYVESLAKGGRGERIEDEV